MAARANVLKLLWGYELNKRLDGSGVSVLACHPGASPSSAHLRMK